MIKNKLLFVLGVAFSILSVICYFSIFSTLGVVMDLRHATLFFAVVGSVLSLAAVYCSEKSNRKYISLLGSVLGVVVFVLMIHELFFVYQSSEVTFQNDGVTLSGTLYHPKNESPVPAVILIHGSGRESREEYEFYARMFARNGIAALAYDKRGVNRSEGNTYEVGYEGYAEDAYAGLQFLKNQSFVNKNKIGVWGFSEGEWVAPLVAQKADSLAFMIVVSPSGRSPLEQVEYEITSSMQRQGFSEEVIDSALLINNLLTEYLRSGKDSADALKRGIEKFRNEPWYQTAELPELRYNVEEYAWWRKVMDFPALETWSEMDCPVLLISGGEDLKSPVEDSHSRIVSALKKSGNDKVTSIIYPKADHSLTYRWLPGNLPPPAFPENYPHSIVNWVESTINKNSHQ